jgi:hypothetical protein
MTLVLQCDILCAGEGQGDTLATAVHFREHSSSLNLLRPTFSFWTSCQQILDKPTQQKLEKSTRQ